MGVYANDKSKSKSVGAVTDVTIGIKKAAVVNSGNGAKKTWVGPSVRNEGNTIVAGGWTKWTKTDSDLQSWLCQNATAFPALSDDDWTIQTYLWDKTAKKQWLWTFRNDEFKYYEFDSSIATFELDDESPKKQLDDNNDVPSAKF